MKKVLFTLYIFIFTFNAIAQNNVTTRVIVKTGNYVEFYVNHLDDYENGMSLENYTTLQIEYNDTVSGGIANPSGPGWELNVRAMSASIESIDSGETLPLDLVEFRVFHESATNTFTLNSTDTEIATGTDRVNYVADVIISYDIGKTNPINIVSNERFVVELMFTIKTKD
ncbi:hypothetical protein [Salinivirga cyanobacteriivorans]|uniref:hypothetical protein n=1 Tax=Salinivirga cyanobacteriivorans TaxID=1307839 RepID=UPI0012FE1EEE|nr:hypothetical protein [Salinivirga cyanobacteriivorans]